MPERAQTVVEFFERMANDIRAKKRDYLIEGKYIKEDKAAR